MKFLILRLQSLGFWGSRGFGVLGVSGVGCGVWSCGVWGYESGMVFGLGLGFWGRFRGLLYRFDKARVPLHYVLSVPVVILLF